MPARQLTLYKQLLRTANRFNDYNVKQYTIRRIRTGYRENINETDPTKIDSLVNEARSSLEQILRLTTINSLYSSYGTPLVVETVNKQ